MMPKNWKSCRLGNIVRLKRGYDLRKADRNKNGIVPVVSSSGVTGLHNKAKSKAPGVVTGRYGTIGQFFYLENDFWPLNTTLYVQDFKGNLPIFIFYFLQTLNFTRYSDKTSVPGVNRNDLHRIKVKLPPLEEQHKIAEILSAWDEAITLTERLIEAKQKRKKGLMQQLLTGKVRLPGFEGSEWDKRKLGDICKVSGGKRLPKGNKLVEKDTGYPYIRVSDMNKEGISSEGILFITEDIAPKLSRYRIYQNELYISVAGTLGLVGKIPSKLDGANLTENANRISNILINPDFLLQTLRSTIIQNAIRAEATLNAQPKLALTRIRKFKIKVPSLEEQQKIADILKACDDEIDLLQQKAAALREQKKGLMQQLLTGKVRVKM